MQYYTQVEKPKEPLLTFAVVTAIVLVIGGWLMLVLAGGVVSIGNLLTR